MPSDSLIVVDGFLRTLPDGTLVTDRNGAPCCCGGGPTGCCICVDPLAAPDDRCFFAYDPPPAKQCNSSPSCCCGTKMRVTAGIAGIYHEETTHDQAYMDISLAYTLVYDLFIKDIGGGKCVSDFTLVSFHYEYHKHFHNQNGQDTYDDQVHGDDWWQYGHTKFNILMQIPQAVCRPEPVYVSNSMLLQNQQFNPEKYFQPPQLSSWREGFLAKGCSGKVEFDNGVRYERAQWSSSAACRSATLSADTLVTVKWGNNWLDTFQSSQTGTLSAVTIIDDCCPPGIKVSSRSAGPFNPANPGGINPGNLGCGGCQDGGAGLGEAL